jgi:transcriptional regulator with PAS, ATPase and Fis domain
MVSLQSYFEDYKNGIGFKAAINNYLKINPKHPLMLAIQRMRQAQVSEHSLIDTIELSKEFDYTIYEIEGQLIYLFNLILIYIGAGRIESANSIYSVMKKIASSKLAPEFQILPIQAKCELLTDLGKRKQRNKEIEKCLKILGPESGRYKVTGWVYLIDLCRMGNIEKLNQQLKAFKSFYNDVKFKKFIEIVILFKHMELGYIDEANSSLKIINEGTFFTGLENDIDLIGKYCQINSNQELEKIDESNSNNWNLLSYVYLIKNEPKLALFWAQKLADKIGNSKYESMFFNYCLIRADLANGNVNAAEYFLNHKLKIENESIFDDFFWFRIYHLKKNNKKAQYYFDKFSQSADTFDLNRRFDIELKLSPEISLTDLRNYSQKRSLKFIEKEIPDFSKINQNINPSFIGKSKVIFEIKKLISQYALIDKTILVVGETGTGKELVAKALWQESLLAKQPFLPINCGAISDHLLQSEIFGHKKGAFTGAIQDHKGIFEEAKEGVVFLDEIGEISPQMQVSLLRILETGEYRPVGSNEIKKIKCKIIAATNRNLENHVKNGLFREDLQYRLERFVIDIPPLRERPEDIPDLIHYFLNEINKNLPNISFDKQALTHLKTLPWPGNIRELRNEMERIRLFYSDKQVLSISELSEKYQHLPLPKVKAQTINASPKSSPLNLKSKFRKLNELKDLFKIHQNLSRTEVATLLNVSANTAASYLNTLEKESFIKNQNALNKKANIYQIL